MTESSGSFNGRTRLLNVLSLADVPGHELHTIEVVGTHSSPDEKWNNAHVTYWAVSDLVAGNGSQRGYYVTEHPDGGRGRWNGDIRGHERGRHLHRPYDFANRRPMFMAGEIRTRHHRPSCLIQMKTCQHTQRPRCARLLIRMLNLRSSIALQLQ
jgi:hypothetical protein